MASQLEEERKQYEEQLEIVAASLKDDPGNAELQALKDELDQMMQMIDESLAELKPPAAAAPTSKPAAFQQPAPSQAASLSSNPPPPQQEKWSRENHPAFKKPTPPTPTAAHEEHKDEVVVAYQVNDTVLAKWVSGDKGFYPARITAVTGSSTKPMYTVKFKSYDTIETLGARNIRPVSGSGSTGAGGGAGAGAAQKRKADDDAQATHAHQSSTSSGNGVVKSAPATVYPAVEKTDEEKPVKKFKKIKATKELEKGKSKWQEFNAKVAGGKLGKGKKESMFRTPEGVGGRVGFVGSGQTMRKDPTRTRHIYQPAEDQD
ncbi:hypothetical protein GE09DRAFT_947260 [Coniochaeta sp. 2T2.1]|nr:hypothetical protein GE09DRAFT_947260 [Coniochaeta sp. 2T2.1]